MSLHDSSGVPGEDLSWEHRETQDGGIQVKPTRYTLAPGRQGDAQSRRIANGRAMCHYQGT
jgi:hypothetical protein